MSTRSRDFYLLGIDQRRSQLVQRPMGDDEGIGIVRDAANAKAQIFVNDAGWFTYSLMVNASRL